MTINNDQISDWLNSEVTQTLWKWLESTVETQTETLVLSAGDNPSIDRYRSGVICTARDILNLDFLERDE